MLLMHWTTKNKQMNKSVLVIDDDKMLRDTLTNGLRKQSFTVFTADSAEAAHEILGRISVDAMVLDRMMPGQDGLSFLKQIRAKGDTTPVIMLTAMSGSDNAISGLAEGADDYLPKPFQFQELVLRLKNITNRTNPTQPQNVLPTCLIYSDGEFFIKSDNTGTKELLSLSNEEKKLLQSLTQPFGNIVSATPMVAKRLRNKINSVSSNIDIITVRGMGYKIVNTKR